MNTKQTEVIIIGAGLAGMIAACAAEAKGAEVLLLDRSSLGVGTNSALSNGVFAGPTSTYSEEAYVEDTLPDRPGPQPTILGGAGGPGGARGHRIPGGLRPGDQTF